MAVGRVTGRLTHTFWPYKHIWQYSARVGWNCQSVVLRSDATLRLAKYSNNTDQGCGYVLKLGWLWAYLKHCFTLIYDITWDNSCIARVKTGLVSDGQGLTPWALRVTFVAKSTNMLDKFIVVHNLVQFVRDSFF